MSSKSFDKSGQLAKRAFLLVACSRLQTRVGQWSPMIPLNLAKLCQTMTEIGACLWVEIRELGSLPPRLQLCMFGFGPTWIIILQQCLSLSQHFDEFHIYLLSQMMYFIENGNVLTKENLQRVQEVENAYLEDEDFKNKLCRLDPTGECLKPQSLVRFFDGTFAYISPTFNDPEFNNISGVIHEANEYVHPLLSFFNQREREAKPCAFEDIKPTQKPTGLSPILLSQIGLNHLLSLSWQLLFYSNVDPNLWSGGKPYNQKHAFRPLCVWIVLRSAGLWKTSWGHRANSRITMIQCQGIGLFMCLPSRNSQTQLTVLSETWRLNRLCSCF